MNFEEMPNIEKINLPAEDKEFMIDELENIGNIIQSLESGDNDYAYADTSDSMEELDNILGENPIYQALLENRKEASRKIMNSNEDEKKTGFNEIKEWVNKVKEIL